MRLLEGRQHRQPVVCAKVGRRLIVCDSFQGLPDEGLQRHTAPHFGTYGYYKEGMFCGRLEEVQENVRRLGRIDVCDFVPGFFSESLKDFARPAVFAFLDVDLVSSTQDCVKAIWPNLMVGGRVYTDDAGDLEVVKVFFDQPWWSATLGGTAPGYVGSGCGLPLNPQHSSFGYAQKEAAFEAAKWQRAEHLYYPEK